MKQKNQIMNMKKKDKKEKSKTILTNVIDAASKESQRTL